LYSYLEETYFSKLDDSKAAIDEEAIITLRNNSIENADSSLMETQANFIEAYIRTISNYIENSQESTLQGLNIAIKRCTEKLFIKIKEENVLPNERSILSLKACSEILINIINKHISKKLNYDFEIIKKSLVTITQDLRLLSVYAKDKISNFFNWSIKNGMTFLIHGYSNIILHTLINAKKSGVNFKVLITESRPDNTGELMAKSLKEYGIDSKIILDISIGYFIMDIDAILVGADAVCENGGIINRIGTFTIACCAKSFKKPFYVMVESLKFLKMYPLNQSDVPFPSNTFKKDNDLEYNYGLCDFTAPEFITLLFTDIGIFTPSAVSDELIQMFYN
jgi:translation initiation factor eIF-2B subunit alpha